MKFLVEETEKAWQALGNISYGSTTTENTSIKFQRSVYVVEDIKEGEEFTPENIRLIRPGDGLRQKYYDILLGKKVNKDVKMGTPLSWDIIG